MSDIEDALYSLERTMESNFKDLWKLQYDICNALSELRCSIDELRHLHKIDDDPPASDASEMLKQTYEKHQFAKRLVLGDQNDRK